MIRLWKFKVKKSEFHIQTDDILYVKKAIFIDQNLSLASQPYNFCGNLAIYVDIYWAFFKHFWGAIFGVIFCVDFLRQFWTKLINPLDQLKPNI